MANQTLHVYNKCSETVNKHVLQSLALPFKRSHSKTVNYSCYPLTLEDIFFVHIFPFVNMLVI